MTDERAKTWIIENAPSYVLDYLDRDIPKEHEVRKFLRGVANNLDNLNTSDCPFWLQEDVARMALDVRKVTNDMVTRALMNDADEKEKT